MNVHIPERYREGYERSLRLYERIREVKMFESVEFDRRLIVNDREYSKYWSNEYFTDAMFEIVKSYGECNLRHIVTALYIPEEVDSMTLHLYTANRDTIERIGSFDVCMCAPEPRSLESILKESKSVPTTSTLNYILDTTKNPDYIKTTGYVHYPYSEIEVDGVKYRRVVPVYPFMYCGPRDYCLIRFEFKTCTSIKIGIETFGIYKIETELENNDYTFIINTTKPTVVSKKQRLYCGRVKLKTYTYLSMCTYV